MLNIAITTGEPAGIGPDITVAALLHLARQASPRSLWLSLPPPATAPKLPHM